MNLEGLMDSLAAQRDSRWTHGRFDAVVSKEEKYIMLLQ